MSRYKNLGPAQEFLIKFLIRNPLFYCFVVFYFQWNRVKNLLESSGDLLSRLERRYPFHALAYQVKLATEYNPFPEYLNSSLFSRSPFLTFDSIKESHRWSSNMERGTFDPLDPFADQPDPNDLLVLYSLLDAARALRLLTFYIPIIFTLLTFSLFYLR